MAVAISKASSTVSFLIGHFRIPSIANVTTALRCQRIPPVVAMPRFPGANEPCLRHSENAIRRRDVRRGNACLSFCLLLYTT